MIWVLYEQVSQVIPDSRKRRWFTDAEDWDALRDLDNQRLQDKDGEGDR